MYSRCRKNGERFYALRNKKQSRFFLALKKTRNIEKIKASASLKKIVSVLAIYANNFKTGMITIPPASSEDVGFAEIVATMISKKSNIKFKKVFESHGKGKRIGMRNKLDGINFNLITQITNKRIFLFDDFSQTQWTMTGAIQTLKRNGNDVLGFVIYAN